MMLQLSDIRDWIKTLNIVESNNCYIGKLDNKKDKSIGVYQLKEKENLNISLGGLNNTKTFEKSVSILIHWNMNAKETEEESWKLYHILQESRGVMVHDKKINYIKLLVPEPIDVGTDEKNIYERVIQAVFYYEKKEEL